MFRKSLALVPVVAALLLGPALHAHAQTVQWVSQTGTITQDNSHYMTISVNITQFTSNDPTQTPQVSGTVNMTGSTGVLSMNLGAPIKVMNFGTSAINKKATKWAKLTSGGFNYVDLNTGKRSLAYMQATVMQTGKGGFSFQIVDSLTGVTLAASASPDGQLNTFPLASGSTTIVF